MIRQFIVKAKRLFLLAIIVLMGSCNNVAPDTGSNDKAAIDSGNTTPAEQAVVTQPAAPLPGGYLDTLYVDSLKFASLLKSKVVFSFTFLNPDTLTLHGWNAIEKSSGDSFNTAPNIKLIKGKASGLSYGPGTYFGNIILHKDEVKDIKKALDTSHAQYVLFAPQKLGEHIMYKIFLSKENPAALYKTMAIIATDIFANPSPPKEY